MAPSSTEIQHLHGTQNHPNTKKKLKQIGVQIFKKIKYKQRYLIYINM